MVCFSAASLSARADLLYVSLATDVEVLQTSNVGAGFSSFATLPNGDAPGGLAVDKSGSVYVSDPTSNVIYKFASSGGSPIATITDPNLVSPQGLAIDASGNLYAAASSSGTIEKFSASSGFTIGTTYVSGLTGSPHQIGFDSSGNLFISNPDVYGGIAKVLPGGGSYTDFVKSTNQDANGTYWGIAFDPNGDLYGSLHFGNVQVWDSNENSLGPISGFSPISLFGLAVDSAGDLFAATNRTNGHEIDELTFDSPGPPESLSYSVTHIPSDKGAQFMALFTSQSVPEPGSLLLVCGGLVPLLFVLRLFRRGRLIIQTGIDNS